MSSPDLVVIVPSRGRPERASTLAEVFRQTTTANTTLVFALDEDDERLPGYRGLVQTAQMRMGEVTRPNRNMVQALNQTVAAVLAPSAVDPPFAIGFMGDDHCPRTYGWDAEYLKALHEMGTGIVYGNDLLQGENLPTQVAMTSDIIRALGYMSPPTLRHMYVDNFWRDLGNAAGCLRYLPEVIVEHRHPIAHKAEWDEGYVRVNAAGVYAADKAAYERYLAESFESDVAKVKALRAAVAS